MTIISVVIPLYNKERFIARAIESVLQQTVTDFELIVVDDGSTDNGYEVAKSFSDDRISVLQQDNMGEGAARNTGLRHANTEWVAFLDADDAWKKNHLETIISIIRLCPDASLVSTGIEELPDGASPTYNETFGDIRYVDYLEDGRNSPIVSSSSAAVNWPKVNRMDFLSYPRGCDTVFWVSCALNYKVAISTARTAIYFRGTGGIIDTYNENDTLYKMPHIHTIEQFHPATHFALNNISKFNRSRIIKYADFYINKYIKGAIVRRKYHLARDAVYIYSKHRKIYYAILPLFYIPGLMPLMLNAYYTFRRK